MKTIVFIISSLQKLGGSERVATSIANELCTKYNITIISRGDYTTKNAYTLKSNVNNIKFIGNNYTFLKSVKKYLKNTNPDIVVIHSMSKLTPLLLLSGVKAKSLWSLEHTSFEFHPLAFKILRKILYKKLNKILVLTASQKEIYTNLNKNLDVSIIRNPSPFPIKQVEYNVSSKLIVSVGSLEHHKGFDMLLKSWSKLSRKYPDWSLHIYGEGSERAKLNNMIQKYKLHNVKLKGQTSQIREVYDNASFYVLSSRYEGLPMVLIEAQARGLPVVSFNCQNGPGQIIENNLNGILVPPKDINKLAEKIELLIKNPAIRVDMSCKSIVQSERFGLSKVIASWCNLIENS